MNEEDTTSGAAGVTNDDEAATRRIAERLRNLKRLKMSVPEISLILAKSRAGELPMGTGKGRKVMLPLPFLF